MGTKQPKEQKWRSQQTPTFLLELPLAVNAGQAKRIRGHLEAGRQFYNAVLSAGQRRLRRMQADPAWQLARAIPRTHTQERRTAFSALRERYGFSEYAFHELARERRVSWLADHLDAVLAQTLATRAYRALNRVCVGEARRVRFKSRGRGLSSIENKRNDTGLRFVLQQPAAGNQGCLIWKDDQLVALIDWMDPVVKYGLDHRIKYARLLQRKASSPQAQGADPFGFRYSVQLALEGVPYRKPKHSVGSDTIGADLGPSTIALVPREAEARLAVFCQELAPDEQAVRRLQRKMDRQRRAANPDNYDSMGRVKKHSGKRGEKGKVGWKSSKTYQKTRRRKAAKERRLAAHRKSLHGRLVHEIVAVGNTIILEKISYQAWQKQDGTSVGLRAPGMFIEMLRRTGAAPGRHPARSFDAHDQTLPILPRLRAMREETALTALASVRLWYWASAARPLLGLFSRLSGSSRTHPLVCEVMSLAGKVRRRACGQHTSEPCNVRMRGRSCPKALVSPEPERVCPKVGAKPHKSCFSSQEGKVEAWKRRSEPPVLEPGESSVCGLYSSTQALRPGVIVLFGSEQFQVEAGVRSTSLISNQPGIAGAGAREPGTGGGLGDAHP